MNANFKTGTPFFRKNMKGGLDELLMRPEVWWSNPNRLPCSLSRSKQKVLHLVLVGHQERE